VYGASGQPEEGFAEGRGSGDGRTSLWRERPGRRSEYGQKVLTGTGRGHGMRTVVAVDEELCVGRCEEGDGKREEGRGKGEEGR
jgi:hypothetical protein